MAHDPTVPSPSLPSATRASWASSVTAFIASNVSSNPTHDITIASLGRGPLG
eukprot:CAMPEP_0171305184 /NCGR_PEP_ID=MMETSP0816-20121228/14979_1 /TAXON_ID=420281 /ORGANISM="Proboscia inermis, Strain CCAP1064/1" /LENGTH=51 /DNA_ID=CAMNT_0011785807 /DNA_START=12 /DNA_END=163 /DNA_ORIENTATION=+